MSMKSPIFTAAGIAALIMPPNPAEARDNHQELSEVANLDDGRIAQLCSILAVEANFKNPMRARPNLLPIQNGYIIDDGAEGITTVRENAGVLTAEYTGPHNRQNPNPDVTITRTLVISGVPNTPMQVSVAFNYKGKPMISRDFAGNMIYDPTLSPDGRAQLEAVAADVRLHAVNVPAAATKCAGSMINDRADARRRLGR